MRPRVLQRAGNGDNPVKNPTTLALSLALGGCLALAATGKAPATVHHAAPMMSGAAAVAHGKALSASLHCNSCHAADMNGKKGFSPSLHTAGVLREYNAKTWARVLDTGVTNDGGMVKKPMPVYHLKPKDSAALWAYCKTLK